MEISWKSWNFKLPENLWQGRVGEINNEEWIYLPEGHHIQSLIDESAWVNSLGRSNRVECSIALKVIIEDKDITWSLGIAVKIGCSNSEIGLVFTEWKLVVSCSSDGGKSNRPNIIFINNNFAYPGFVWDLVISLSEVNILLWHVEDISILSNKRSDDKAWLRPLKVEGNNIDKWGVAVHPKWVPEDPTPRTTNLSISNIIPGKNFESIHWGFVD